MPFKCALAFSCMLWNIKVWSFKLQYDFQNRFQNSNAKVLKLGKALIHLPPFRWATQMHFCNKFNLLTASAYNLKCEYKS